MHRIKLSTILLLAVLFITIAPSSALAYSYGNANTEDVAETFKLVIASLEQSSPDWNKALKAHKERREEIESHFGADVAATLDADFKSKSVDSTVADYKALLVMNLDRRFENVLQSVKDYSKSKLLLAKARATYETLAPYIEAKLSPSETKAISADFDAALKAIGNPGLFGVGKEAPDEAALKTTVNRIYETIKPLFPYHAGAGTDGSADEGTNTPSEPDSIEGTKQHAAMERTDKTNSGVTIGVIGGIVILAAAGVWWAKRKGII
ncbi:hypothetical protein [Paenibacillus sp. R14(2021)]|uniref:hypothetical protein n=1 Tax=Paenibacillus sp. R14(2021) TaxID=2859228 RepID=UPI001C614035|nr:hypothetical protein [Paenibacillus sp. R14(2021)]